MKRALIASSALAAVALMAANTAQAAERGFYGSIGAGLNWLDDSDIKGGAIRQKTDNELGGAGEGAIGYAYGNGFRSEVELGYRKNEIDKISGASAKDDIDTWTLMVNGLYDFHTNTRFTPYVGIGAGIARVNYDNVSPVATTRIDDTDDSFAMQGILGVSYMLTQQLDLFGTYQYLHAFNPSLKADNGTSVDVDYDANTLLVGLRFRFGAPVTMKQPAEVSLAPSHQEPVVKGQSRSYLVFFDWDKADITQEAQEVLAKAAKDATRGHATRIVLTGHADRSGPDGYNMGLSKRRAQNVKKALSALGLRESEMEVIAKGEREPLVQTPDGVREPQNRRVEIVYGSK